IPPDSYERVFVKFEQLASATTRKVGGTGLGLAIARGIVEGHGGRIWVEPVTEGAEFVFTLPCAPPDKNEVDEAPAAAHTQRSVLVVDDDVDATCILKGMLVSVGYRVYTAQDGDAALA